MKYEFQGNLLNVGCAQVPEGSLEFVEHIEGMKNYKRKERYFLNEHSGDRVCSVYREKLLWGRSFLAKGQGGMIAVQEEEHGFHVSDFLFQPIRY